ncbi:metallophosphoesterase family protein [Sphingomonas sp. FW199]|uniref:metallophosphoesterase family protein n=1 Tax=Sphingomonas sp. FW199 TaxID=3400217 RepID=UPI003CEE8745
MLSRLFRRSAALPKTVPGRIPDGMRVYAIGDVHGRLDLLDALLARIDAEDAARGPAERHLVFLGDLMDRGPDSAGVIDRVMRLAQADPRVRLLIGNHEEVMISALEGKREALRLFHRIGGRPTMHSYGVSEAEIMAADWDELAAAFQAAVPPEHLAFLKSGEDLIEIGDYAFVHAGIHPDVPLAQQKVADLRWIREPFLTHRAALPRIVVHGHTITDGVEWMTGRIGVDTGAYASGRLSALAIEGDERWIVDVEGAPSEGR